MLMNRTLNLAFKRMEDHLTRLRAIEDSFSADNKALINDLELFIVVAADATVIAEEATGQVSEAPSAPQKDQNPEGEVPAAGQYL